MSGSERGTLVDLLIDRGAQEPSRRAYVFVSESGDETPLSYGELLRRVKVIGGALQRECDPGARVLLIFPPGQEFVTAFFGCVAGGVVAVPAYPPDPVRLARTLPRLRAITSDARVTCVLTTAAIKSLVGMLQEMAPELAALRWIAADDLVPELASRWRAPALTSDSIAFLQYTSGSTAEPKGVMVSHGNVLHNSAAILRLADHTRESVYVCWVPNYHDMGLIGGIILPLHGGLLGVLMSPIAFLHSPVRWLEAITRYRGTATPFPNFALDLCVRRIPPADRAGLDLGSLRVACNGAEPIRLDTIERFTEAFAPFGFRHEAHYPAYGLAEATLLVTGRRLADPMRTVSVRRDALAAGRVETVAGDGTQGGCRGLAPSPQGAEPPSTTAAQHIVGCGVSLPDQELLIVDPERLVPCAADRVGEIWLRGPSVARGYWGRPEETARVFGARLGSGEGPYLRTGDLGFLSDGELYVTGRLKDLIIVRGRNLYPQDIERSAERCHPQVRAGCVAAFSIDTNGEEGLAIAAEVDVRKGPVDPDAIWAALKDAMVREHDIAPSVAVLLEPGALPKTSSGKLQRRATRSALVSGTLNELHRFTASSEPVRVVPLVAVREPDSSASAAIYESLEARFAKLDARSTRYRFDLEKEISWDRIHEPGLHAGAHLLGGRVNLAALRERRDVDEHLQWLVAANLSDAFIALEEAVVRFTVEERLALGPTRSIEMLALEERKHVEAFERYGEHLRRLRPELRADADSYRRACEELLNRLIAGASEQYSSPAERHYASWLFTLFFEEFTVYVHRRLAQEEAGLIQPTWLSLHRAHAQEEAQHVVTDVAYLAAMRATDEERYTWSKRAFELLARDFLPAFALPSEHALRVCARIHPEMEGRLAQVAGETSTMLALLEDRAFAQTRAAGPYFAHLLARAGAASVRNVSERSAEAEGARGWLVRWLATHARCDARSIDERRTFQSYGLDSLQMIVLSGDLSRFAGRQLSATAAYDHPTVELLAEHILRAPPLPSAERERVERPGPLPCSSRQERLFYVDRKHQGSVLDHVTQVYTSVALDEGALASALARLAARHEALRVEICEDDDGPVQYAVPSLDRLPLEHVARTAPNEAAWLEEVRRLALAQDRAPFDLGRAPLWRAMLVRGPSGAAALVFTAHHMVFDGWSGAVLHRDLSALYGEAIGVGPACLPPLGRQHADVAASERSFLRSEAAAARRAWWRERIGGHRDVRSDRVFSRAFDGAAAARLLPARAGARLSAIARRHGVSLYVVLLAAFQEVLVRRYGDEDVLLNTHLFNRASEDERAMIGYFVNVLTLRAELRRDLAFPEVLRRVHLAWMDALAHALPISEVVRAVRPDGYAERFMPSANALNMLTGASPAADVPAAGGALRECPELSPPPGFMFFDRMLLVSPGPDERPWLTLWFNREAVSKWDAETLLTELVARLERIAP